VGSRPRKTQNKSIHLKQQNPGPTIDAGTRLS
jgi:hypothetical protein